MATVTMNITGIGHEEIRDVEEITFYTKEGNYLSRVEVEGDAKLSFGDVWSCGMHENRVLRIHFL